MKELDVIQKVIDTKIRPYLQSHMGNLEIIEYKQGILRIKLLGHCEGCPSAQLTTENFIQQKLKQDIEELKKVVIIDDINEELYNIALRILRGEKVFEN